MYNTEEPKNVISKRLKCFLFAFNLFYWAFGGVMLSVGIWSIKHKSSYKELSYFELPISNATDPAAILAIVVGCLIFFISFFGIVGTLRENICLLETYKWMMVIIVILQFLAGVLAFVFWPEVQGSVEDQIKKGIVNYRDDLDLQNFIDRIQAEFKCCGSSNINDWDINRYFKCNGPSPEECGVPHSCCIMEEGQSINVKCGWQARRKDHLTLAEKKIYTVGCVDAIISLLRHPSYVVGALAIAFVFPEFLGIILTHIFVGQINEQIAECNKPPVHKYRPHRHLTSDL